jgi:hypothetical protein
MYISLFEAVIIQAYTSAKHYAQNEIKYIGLRNEDSETVSMAFPMRQGL